MAVEVDEETRKLAEPRSEEEMTIECWYMDDKNDDQRNPHKKEPNVPASPADLRRLGVVSWSLDADKYEKDPKLEAIRKVRGYTYQDVITISRDTLPGYEDKLKIFYKEHIHDDEEIRYILDGSGYFDVRDEEDRWIRIHCKKGDMIVLPEGIYHRFTLDNDNYTKAMRLFVGDPVWTPINRDEGAEAHAARKNYLDLVASLNAGAAA